MSGGQEDAWRAAQAKVKIEEEARASEVFHQQEIALKLIGVSFIELLDLIGKYKEIK